MPGILLLGFALRVLRIGQQRVWWDEGWSVWVARFSPLEILRQTGNDVHPPLYFELLHFWRAISGDSETGLRLLAAFLGLLTIAATFALGRRMARNTMPPAAASLAGTLAALFLTLSRFAVAWSQEIRMYALASLLAVLAVWAARRVWERDLPRDRVAYVLAIVAGLYTLYLSGLVWAAVNVAWLWVVRGSTGGRRRFLRWAGLQLAVLALFLPWGLYAADGFLSTAAATPIRPFDFLHIYWTVLTVGIPLEVSQFNRLTLPALAIFVLALASLMAAVARRSRASGSARRARRDLSLLLAMLLLPAIVIYFISLPRQNFYNPPFNPRYLVIFTSFYSILLAWGLVAVGEWIANLKGARAVTGRLVTLLLAALMIAFSLAGLWPYYPGRVLVDDYPSLVDTLNAYRRPEDAVILYSDTDWPIFAYHYPEEWRGLPHLWSVTPELADTYLTPVWDSHDAVWLVTTPYSASTDPQRQVPAWLADHASAVREFTYKDMALTLYAKAGRRAGEVGVLIQTEPEERVDIPLAAGSRLLGFSQAAGDFKSGDVAHLFIYWTGPEPLDTEVGLIDASGRVWQPTPVSLPGAPTVDRRQVDVIVPPEAPSGSYQFYIRGQDGRPSAFGNVTVRQKQSEFLTREDVTIANPVDAQFAGDIRLDGYDLPVTQVRPGETVQLTLYWSSGGDIRQRYKVFTHLLGDVFNAANGNFLWGQADNEPAGNTRPTTSWRDGETIVDEYAIPVPAGTPPGEYRLEIGLYDPATGARLPVLDENGSPSADHLILATVEVVP